MKSEFLGKLNFLKNFKHFIIPPSKEICSVFVNKNINQFKYMSTERHNNCDNYISDGYLDVFICRLYLFFRPFYLAYLPL